MTLFPPAPFTQAITCLLSEIDKASSNPSAEINPEQMDRLARSISTHLKSLSDLDAYNHKTAEAADTQKYTAYEDLPPPSPADQDRFYIRLESLIRGIDAGTIKDPDIVSTSDTLQ